MTHDPLCPRSRLSCECSDCYPPACMCDTIWAIRTDTHERTRNKVIDMDISQTFESSVKFLEWLDGYEAGVAKEREFWMNPCLLCGMDDWSTYVCEDCEKRSEEERKADLEENE